MSVFGRAGSEGEVILSLDVHVLARGLAWPERRLGEMLADCCCGEFCVMKERMEGDISCSNQVQWRLRRRWVEESLNLIHSRF